jgi:hypothetical protein
MVDGDTNGIDVGGWRGQVHLQHCCCLLWLCCCGWLRLLPLFALVCACLRLFAFVCHCLPPLLLPEHASYTDTHFVPLHHHSPPPPPTHSPPTHHTLEDWPTSVCTKQWWKVGCRWTWWVVRRKVHLWGH